MAKDLAGNKIEVGTFVRIDMPSHVFGRVKKIEPGGTIIATGLKVGGQRVDEVKPGLVYVEIIAQNSFDPRNEMCNAIIAVVDPDPETKAKMQADLKAERKLVV